MLPCEVKNICTFLYEDGVLVVWQEDKIIKKEKITYLEQIEEELLEIEEQGFALINLGI